MKKNIKLWNFQIILKEYLIWITLINAISILKMINYDIEENLITYKYNVRLEFNIDNDAIKEQILRNMFSRKYI